MRGLWHATSRKIPLKIPFSEKDSGQKDKKQKNTAIFNMIMLCGQTGCIVISFPKHTKKALMCSPKALLPHSLSCKETVKVTVKEIVKV